MATKEQYFYDVCDKIETIKGVDLTAGYYPTVEELIAHDIEENISLFVPILVYFSSNPFKRLDYPEKDEKDYIKLVKYCNDLLQDLDLTD